MEKRIFEYDSGPENKIEIKIRELKRNRKR